MKYFFFLFSFMIYSFIGMSQRLVVGTYTNNDLSKGIYLYDFDTNSGKAAEKSFIITDNPSYLAIDERHHFVYCVNEENKGFLSSFSYDADLGKLKFINTQPNNGSSPCYISIDQTGKWLFTANYSDGSLSVHPKNADGSIGTIHQYIKHGGSSINKDRQEAPHVHCVYISADNKRLYVPDLGLDKVVIYPFDAVSGLLDTLHKSFISVKPGGGPRHIIFDKTERYGYLVEEMSGTVNVIQKGGNNDKIIQSVNRLPKGTAGAGADIHLSPDEKFLYVSQRSNSTIETFKVNQKTGKISFVKAQSTMGNFPRNFTIHPSGKYLLVGHQKSNDIVIFNIDIRTGALTDSGNRIKVGSPVCLLWIDSK